jgi:type III secretory pathway component EscR
VGNKKDFIDYFANYLFTGVALIVVVFLIREALGNLRVVINMTLIMLGIIFSGAVVYEGINYIYKKW